MCACPSAERHPPRGPAALSVRQRDCLALAATGLSSARIAERLGLSPRTVDEHLALACRALGVRTRVQAVARYVAAAPQEAEPRSFLDPAP